MTRELEFRRGWTPGDYREADTQLLWLRYWAGHKKNCIFKLSGSLARSTAYERAMIELKRRGLLE